VAAGYAPVQVFSVRRGILPAAEIRRTKQSTEFVFLSRPTLQVIRRLPGLLRGAALVLFNNESRLSMITAILAKIAGRRVMAFYHNEPEPCNAPLRRILTRIYRSWVIDAAITTTGLLEQSWKPLLGCRLCRFPFGVDTEKFRPAFRPSGDRLHVLYCGRISPEKRIEDLIEGIAGSSARNRIVLTIAGEDYSPGASYLNNLLAACEAAGVSHRLLGHVPHSRLPRIYGDADMLVNMRPDEGFGKVFVEAMASGLPVVGRRGAPGVSQLIRNGVNGFVVGTTQDLSDVLDRLITSPDLRMDVGTRGRAFVEREYSLDASLSALTTCLNSLLTVKDLSCPV
jgi:glycosyltransferase involved in cell wall biosynthesis